MWVICTAIAAVLCLVMFNSMQKEYYKYEVITKTTTISESLALFPSMVMCKEEASTSIIDSVDSCWFNQKSVYDKKFSAIENEKYFDYFEYFDYIANK